MIQGQYDNMAEILCLRRASYLVTMMLMAIRIIVPQNHLNPALRVTIRVRVTKKFFKSRWICVWFFKVFAVAN